MPYFAVRRAPGPGWNASLAMREQALWPEHAAFMNSLVEEGFVLLGGPLRTGDEIHLVIQAESSENVVKRFAQDPWASPETLKVVAVDPWNILVGNFENALGLSDPNQRNGRSL